MRLASRGLRELDGGPEPITDDEERRIVQAQARRVVLESLAATAVAGAVVMLLP